MHPHLAPFPRPELGFALLLRPRAKYRFRHAVPIKRTRRGNTRPRPNNIPFSLMHPCA